MHINYTTPEEFLEDASFIGWLTGADKTHTAEWSEWIKTHPDQQPLVNTATAMFRDLFVEEGISANQLQHAETRLQQVLAPAAGTVPLYRKWMGVAVAAVVTAVIAGSIFLLRDNAAKPFIKTDYGQTSNKILPDGSEVMMNANSTIEYSKGWQEGKDREVWLTGEAFFHVKKTPGRSRFIVHTGKVDVIVTGTRFNVENRDSGMHILLTEGSVTLQTKDGQEVHLKPGDYALLDASNHLQMKSAKEENVLAWKEHKLVFDNTPMTDVVAAIEQEYGLQVKLADEATGKQTVSGILPNDSLDVLLQSLEGLMYKVTRDKDTITIAQPDCCKQMNK